MGILETLGEFMKKPSSSIQSALIIFLAFLVFQNVALSDSKCPRNGKLMESFARNYKDVVAVSYTGGGKKLNLKSFELLICNETEGTTSGRNTSGLFSLTFSENGKDVVYSNDWFYCKEGQNPTYYECFADTDMSFKVSWLNPSANKGNNRIIDVTSLQLLGLNDDPAGGGIFISDIFHARKK